MSRKLVLFDEPREMILSGITPDNQLYVLRVMHIGFEAYDVTSDHTQLYLDGDVRLRGWDACLWNSEGTLIARNVLRVYT